MPGPRNHIPKQERRLRLGPKVSTAPELTGRKFGRKSDAMRRDARS